MPLYTYECVNGHQFDEMRPIDERNMAARCPECDAVAEKIWTAPATPVMDPARAVKGRPGGYR